MKIKGRGIKKIHNIRTIDIIRSIESGMSIKEISKKAKCSYDTIVKILSGEHGVSSDTTEKELKKYGYKLCCCCGERLVPKESIGVFKLELLCPICFRTEDQLDELRVIF